MSAMTALVLVFSLLLGGCSTVPPARGSDPGRTTQKALQKIDRICALPEAERDAQLKKLEAETGVVLFCGK